MGILGWIAIVAVVALLAFAALVLLGAKVLTEKAVDGIGRNIGFPGAPAWPNYNRPKPPPPPRKWLWWRR